MYHFEKKEKKKNLYNLYFLFVNNLFRIEMSKNYENAVLGISYSKMKCAAHAL